jgi:exosortase J
MSTLSAANPRSHLNPPVVGLTPLQSAGVATILAVLGVCSIWSTVGFLWGLWTTDDLKSIGMMIPLVSFVLILRIWRSQHWQMQGSWWGLAILTVTIAAVHIRDQAILVFVVSPQWAIYLPPHSLVAFAYVSGVVLLFGGAKLYRAALFPIILI